MSLIFTPKMSELNFKRNEDGKNKREKQEENPSKKCKDLQMQVHTVGLVLHVNTYKWFTSCQDSLLGCSVINQNPLFITSCSLLLPSLMLIMVTVFLTSTCGIAINHFGIFYSLNRKGMSIFTNLFYVTCTCKML